MEVDRNEQKCDEMDLGQFVVYKRNVKTRDIMEAGNGDYH
jgi:hypothetical protein